jgi:hypothetical protein
VQEVSGHASVYNVNAPFSLLFRFSVLDLI